MPTESPLLRSWGRAPVATFRFARYKIDVTPIPRDMHALLWLVGLFASPLQRPIDVKFKIGAEANTGFAIVFCVSALPNVLEERVQELGNLRGTNKPSYSWALCRSTRLSTLPVFSIVRPAAPKTRQGCESRTPPPLATRPIESRQEKVDSGALSPWRPSRGEDLRNTPLSLGYSVYFLLSTLLAVWGSLG